MSVDPDLLAWMVAADRSDGFRADLLTMITHQGYVLRWTSLDRKVMTLDGRVFVPGPAFSRSRIRLAAGVQVSDMDLTLHVDDSVVVGGLPALHFAERGLFDGCEVTLEWAYFDTAGVFKGLIQRFAGKTGPASLELGEIGFKVRSEIAALNTMVPREVYGAGCLNSLFDHRCGLDADAFSVSGSVTSVPSGRAGVMQFTASGLAQAAGYFELGAIEFRTGTLAKVTRTVKAHAAGGVLSVAMAWPQAPAVGDTFKVVPGCNRTMGACANKFNNLRFGRLAFRGTPFVPAPETVA